MTGNARRLRRQQTREERELWRALRAGRFAGFKFRRQHPVGPYCLDFYCPFACLSVELDGFQHGLPEHIESDQAREKFLAKQGIEVLRFWNRQWKSNRDGILLEIWNALQRRTGCAQTTSKQKNHRYLARAHLIFLAPGARKGDRWNGQCKHLMRWTSTPS